MRRTIIAVLGAATLSVACATIASAADLPIKAPAYKAVTPTVDWTGFYVGLDAGGLWGRADNLINDLPALVGQTKPQGFLYGVHAGYRWQTMSRFVFGVEGDIWGVAGRDAKADNFDLPEVDVLRISRGGSLRLQTGYAIDRALFYMTGGASVIHISGCTEEPDVGSCSVANRLPTQFSGDRLGWTLGGGVDWMLMQNWSVRFEYLYANYGSHLYPSLQLVPPSVIGVHNISTNVARLGLSYLFGAH